MLEGRIRDSAERLLSEIQNRLPAKTLNAALDRGRNLDLDVVVDDLLVPLDLQEGNLGFADQ